MKISNTNIAQKGVNRALQFNMSDYDDTYVMICRNAEESEQFVKYMKENGRETFYTGDELRSMYPYAWDTTGVGYRFNAKYGVDCTNFQAYIGMTHRKLLMYSDFDWVDEDLPDAVYEEDILSFLR